MINDNLKSRIVYMKFSIKVSKNWTDLSMSKN